ncbi:hypothetical protein [Streptomyces sp. KL116D]|uniref:hypothetical protein n=1 Tax=Streptomyces sp. KL116D TaxID=3045152 RepID=UPI0035568230
MHQDLGAVDGACLVVAAEHQRQPVPVAGRQRHEAAPALDGVLAHRVTTLLRAVVDVASDQVHFGDVQRPVELRRVG